MLNYDQLQAAVAAARRRFDLLRKKYPALKAYLVISLPVGQTMIDSLPLKIVSEFPEMVVDDSTKLRVFDVIEKKTKMEKSLKNLSSPDADAELKAKDRARSKLKYEFKSKDEARLEAIAARLGKEVDDTRDYLKALTKKELLEVKGKELLEKIEEIELAEKDFRDLEALKKKKLLALSEKLDQLVSQLKYDEKCHVEIRFNDLNYDLVWKLQTDDLIDRNLTPQTKASIRIVLGTLTQLKA